jgi:hypothetical protein
MTTPTNDALREAVEKAARAIEDIVCKGGPAMPWTDEELAQAAVQAVGYADLIAERDRLRAKVEVAKDSLRELQRRISQEVEINEFGETDDYELSQDGLIYFIDGALAQLNADQVDAYPARVPSGEDQPQPSSGQGSREEV